MVKNDLCVAYAYPSLHGYNNGGQPLDGDRVRCITGEYYMLPYGAEATVTEMRPGSASWLIKLTNIDCNRFVNPASHSVLFKASNFELISRGVEMGVGVKSLTAEVSYVVLDPNARIVGTANTEDDLNEVVGNLLRKDPFAKFRVFGYLKTGRLPNVEVTWE